VRVFTTFNSFADGHGNGSARLHR